MMFWPKFSDQGWTVPRKSPCTAAVRTRRVQISCAAARASRAARLCVKVTGEGKGRAGTELPDPDYKEP